MEMTGNSTWGHCKNCSYFASHAAMPLDGEEAACRHPQLSRFQLQVFGASGCNGFELRPGLPPSAERPEATLSS